MGQLGDTVGTADRTNKRKHTVHSDGAVAKYYIKPPAFISFIVHRAGRYPGVLYVPVLPNAANSNMRI